jgi:hypothetical protein
VHPPLVGRRCPAEQARRLRRPGHRCPAVHDRSQRRSAARGLSVVHASTDRANVQVIRRLVLRLDNHWGGTDPSSGVRIPRPPRIVIMPLAWAFAFTG